MKKDPKIFDTPVPHTTRKPTSLDVDGIYYNFVTDGEFLAHAKQGKFIHTTMASGRMEGVSCTAIDMVELQDHTCIMELDLAGVKRAKAMNIDAKYIFMCSTSVREMEDRMSACRYTQQEIITARHNAELWFEYVREDPCNFHLCIVSDSQLKSSMRLQSSLSSIKIL